MRKCEKKSRNRLQIWFGCHIFQKESRVPSLIVFRFNYKQEMVLFLLYFCLLDQNADMDIMGSKNEEEIAQRRAIPERPRKARWRNSVGKSGHYNALCHFAEQTSSTNRRIRKVHNFVIAFFKSYFIVYFSFFTFSNFQKMSVRHITQISFFSNCRYTKILIGLRLKQLKANKLKALFLYQAGYRS